MKRIVVCADGTWNRPEQLGKDNHPTNVLKFARGIAPKDSNGVKQVVFYDWGIGSYHDKLTGGGMGEGLEKNVMDCYRFLVHNYDNGDEIYLFGFSRGAYTVRSLCGMINNCSLLKSAEGNLIEKAFDIYKTKKYKPRDQYSKDWRKAHSICDVVKVNFVGVWDTVGAMGLPFSIFGLIKDKHLFYDRKLGSNVIKARHALCLDELRADFEPTIWEPRKKVNLEQVWFAGVHCDVGGSYKPDDDGSNLADIPMMWLKTEAHDGGKGLEFEKHLSKPKLNPLSRHHNEYKGKYKLLGKRVRVIPPPLTAKQNGRPKEKRKEKLLENKTWIHHSVKTRYEESQYKSTPIENYLSEQGKWPPIWNGK
ncbi:MAG: hypothetical protein ACJAYC_000434 [Halieaceae bacterium]|jgi:uncharacterized protein (DUF2235 family)